jgi:hypothetical protein
MKHVEIDLYFAREHIGIGDVHILHVPMTSQFTDIFMKDLSTSVFLEFWSSLKTFVVANCGGRGCGC